MSDSEEFHDCTDIVDELVDLVQSEAVEQPEPIIEPENDEKESKEKEETGMVATEVPEEVKGSESEQKETGTIDIVNASEMVSPFEVNLNESVRDVIQRATDNVRSDEFKLALKDGTILDTNKTLKQAGVSIGDAINLVEIDSGYDSSETPPCSIDSDVTIANTEELDEMLAEMDLDKSVADVQEAPTKEIESAKVTDEELDKELEDIGSIIVIGADGNFSELPVSKDDSVSSIITRSTNAQDTSQYDLMHEGRAIPHYITLRDAGIRFGSQLSLRERAMQIFVRDPQGKSATVNVKQSDTVKKLKEAYHEESNVEVHNQRLIYRDRPLENENTLRSYGICNNASVDSTYRLRGGAN